MIEKERGREKIESPHAFILAFDFELSPVYSLNIEYKPGCMLAIGTVYI